MFFSQDFFIVFKPVIGTLSWGMHFSLNFLPNKKDYSIFSLCIHTMQEVMNTYKSDT